MRSDLWWVWVPRVVTALTALAAGTVLLVPGLREEALVAGGHLVRMDFIGLRDHLRTFEDRAWVLSSLLMIAQGLAAPIPAIPITLANALVYGPWLGGLISWASAQVAGVLCFSIGRALGRPFVERMVSPGGVRRFDRFFERYGGVAILAGRLVPVVSFDAVSYAAGLTRVRMRTFLVATGVGQVPAVVAYSHAGASLASSPGTAVAIVLWFVGGVTLLFGIWWVRSRRRDQRGGDPEPAEA